MFVVLAYFDGQYRHRLIVAIGLLVMHNDAALAVQITNQAVMLSLPPTSTGKRDCKGVWSEWSACSAPCGGGTQTKTYIIKDEAKNGGAACAFEAGEEKTQACNEDVCPVDCKGEYIVAYNCSGTTSNPQGFKRWEFKVTTEPVGAGEPCPPSIKEEVCWQPVDCVGHFVTDNCNVTDGAGVYMETFTITQPANSSGNPCPFAEGAKRPTDVPCYVQAACPGHWVDSVCEWSDSTKKCGTGTKQRTFHLGNEYNSTLHNCTSQLSNGTWVELTNGTVDSGIPCSDKACPVDCKFEVTVADPVQAKCNANCTIGNYTGVFIGQVHITAKALDGGKCDTFEGKPVLSTTPCDACCKDGKCCGPVYKWMDDDDSTCKGLCYDNNKNSTWGLPQPVRRRLLTVSHSTPAEECWPVGHKKQVPCGAGAGYGPADAVNKTCCSSRGPWRELTPCNASCGYGIEDKIWYVDPVLRAPNDVANETCLWRIPGGDLSGLIDCEWNSTEALDRECPDLPPCPVPCTGHWENVTDSCSTQCGLGVHYQQQRFIVTTPAAYNGTQCEAAHNATRDNTEVICPTHACNNCTAPAPATPLEGASWNCSNTTHGAVCVGSCIGLAERTVSYTCYDGAYNWKSGTCQVDCVGDWLVDDTSCSATCGTGVTTKEVFNVITPAKNGGMECGTTRDSVSGQVCTRPSCNNCECRGHRQLGGILVP